MNSIKNLTLVLLFSCSLMQPLNATERPWWMQTVSGVMYCVIGAALTVLGGCAIKDGTKNFYVTDSDKHHLTTAHTTFDKRIVVPGLALFIPSVLLMAAGMDMIIYSFYKKSEVKSIKEDLDDN